MKPAPSAPAPATTGAPVPTTTGVPVPTTTAVPASGTNFASRSVPRHLLRGAIGFGLIGGSIALVPVVGPVSLLAAPLALIAFRGCPTCWMVGLVQTISRGRLKRQCPEGDGGGVGICTLTKAQPAPRGQVIP
ncbi:hypothetical protein [Streptomyces sp. NPDC001568]|uniref:hypothetical protein n=1 Tax=Streptomyces sp. NPDC001568 TaxID=3364588 RepID=UPI00369BC6CF